MKKIRVYVVSRKGCKNLSLRYIDPVTGKSTRTATYRDPQTGEEIATGSSRKFAEKLAARWEADLNAGRDQGPLSTSWQQFRLRYETEVVPGLAERTAGKISTLFNAVEKILPRVGNGRLFDLNAEAISKFQASLRDGVRSESTIAGYLAHLRACMAWAADQGLIREVPKIKRPQRAKKAGAGRKSKGRPISGEEFDRLLQKIPAAFEEWRKQLREKNREARRKRGAEPRNTHRGPYKMELSPAAVESWRHYLRGLWLSGLRLRESLELYWDRSDRPCVEMTGRRPMLRIPAECEKGNRDRMLPITPDFAELLLETPSDDRKGRVFRPIMPSGNQATPAQACKMVAIIGELARIVVHADAKSGKAKYASAHDLRRSFGSRWAKRVMPAVLQKLMRHESISTTMGYYVDLDANELAEDLYRAHDKAKSGQSGADFGADTDFKAVSEPSAFDLNHSNTNTYNERPRSESN